MNLNEKAWVVILFVALRLDQIVLRQLQLPSRANTQQFNVLRAEFRNFKLTRRWRHWCRARLVTVIHKT